MNNSKNAKMMQKLTLLMVLLGSTAAFALTGTVTKVNGNRAIVDFDAAPTKGDKVTSDTGDDLDDSAKSTTKGAFHERKYSIEYNFATQVVNSNLIGGNSTTVNGSGTGFVIFGSFEVGPYLSYGSLAQGSLPTASTTGLGVVGQFDIIQNKPGTTFVPGVYLKGVYNSISPNSFTRTDLGGGGSLDWYPLADIFAINISLEYISQSLSGGTNSVNISSSSVNFLSGIKVTF